MKKVKVKLAATTLRVFEVETDDHLTDVQERAWEAMEADDTISDAWKENCQIVGILDA